MENLECFNCALQAGPVAILGAGLSGRAVAALLRDKGIAYDLFDEKAELFTAKAAKKGGLVVYSPSFASDHPWRVLAEQMGCLCVGELDFAAAFWRGPVIAVTGTNGKSSTVQLLTDAFNAAGRPAAALGNIGEPFSAAASLPEGTIAVVEVSSFQAEGLSIFQPSAVLWTNFSEDHLNRHSTLEAYFKAKWKLVERLGESGIGWMGPSVAAAAALYGALLPNKTRIVDYAAFKADASLQGTLFDRPPQLENYALVEHFWKAEGLPTEALVQAARNFRPNQYRCFCIKTVNGVEFWNDTKATNTQSALAAVRLFNKKILWIGGGASKNSNVAQFAEILAPHLKAAFLIGDTGLQMGQCLEKKGIKAEYFEELALAVKAAYVAAENGDIVLLAPGFASFGLFKDYADRGAAFNKAVEAL